MTKNDELKIISLEMTHTQTHEQAINLLKGLYGIMDKKQLIRKIMLDARSLKESQK